MVNFRHAAEWDYTVFPNPNNGNRLGIQLSGSRQPGVIQTDIYSVNGLKILNQMLPVESTGRYLLPIGDVDLPSGSYYIRVTAGGEQISKLLVVKKG